MSKVYAERPRIAPVLKTNNQRQFLLNLALLLLSFLLIVCGYLPTAEELSMANAQLHQQEGQIVQLQGTHAETLRKLQNAQKLYAIPEAGIEHLSEELEALASQKNMTLVNLEPQTEFTEEHRELGIKITPYQIAFSGDSPQDYSKLLASLESQFPEFKIRKFDYQGDIGAIDAFLVSSPQSTRLFSH
jgi:hypothetical protein